MLPLIILFLVLAASVSASAERDDVKKLAVANNEFVFKVRKTFNSQGNVYCSPASAFIALGMLYQGAKGITAEEMRRTLSYDFAGLEDQNLNQIYQNLLSLITHFSHHCMLSFANTIISQAQYPVSEEYKETLKKYYDATVKEVDFIKDSAKDIQEINNWISNKTQGKISEMLESLNPNTDLILLNAIYLNVTWSTNFSSRKTRDQIFYNEGLDAVSVPMMNAKDRVLYAEERDFKVLKLVYKGGHISMVLLLPNNRDGVSKVEKELTASKLDSIISGLVNVTVTINIPKFKLEVSKDLKETLSILGMNSAFSNEANFSGISEESNLKLSKVIHKAIIEVNEESTKGAAITGIGREVISDSIPTPPSKYTFRADHPFLFFIRDEITEMILFCGRISKF